MAEIIWTDPALTDLDAVGDYIALDDYNAARRLIQKVFERVDLLRENPSLGRVPRDLFDTPYRKLVVNPVYVYYRVEGVKVIIIHVTRSERQFDMTKISGRD
ncbi:MAG: type II toxin-antitoxin system RelE/ParE family toxin [Opitutales bacterium]|nr:type II toxin-antitoxin system RelE/ParE family toxin [Opitutales bacterium]